MKPQTGFLLVTTAVVVLGLAALTLVGALQYQRENRAFVSNGVVHNFPYSLLSPEAQEALK